MAVAVAVAVEVEVEAVEVEVEVVAVVAVAARHLCGALRLELRLQLRAQRLRQDRRPRRRRHRGRRRRVLDETLGVVDVALEVAARRAEGAGPLERLALLDRELAPLGFEVLRLDQGGDVLWSGGGCGVSGGDGMG